jgi:hypothetical protein
MTHDGKPWCETYGCPPAEFDRDFADRVAQRVAELPNRTSPDDWPEAMLVTAEELIFIINSEFALLAERENGERDAEHRFNDDPHRHQ